MRATSRDPRVPQQEHSMSKLTNRWAFVALIAVAVAGVAVAQIKRTPSPAGAEAYIITPKDGETVSSPVTVRFGLKGMGVAPAGIAFDNAGHHHLIIDAELPPLNAPVPAD